MVRLHQKIPQRFSYMVFVKILLSMMGLHIAVILGVILHKDGFQVSIL
jgi:hypothetical protein